MSSDEDGGDKTRSTDSLFGDDFVDLTRHPTQVKSEDDDDDDVLEVCSASKSLVIDLVDEDDEVSEARKLRVQGRRGRRHPRIKIEDDAASRVRVNDVPSRQVVESGNADNSPTARVVHKHTDHLPLRHQRSRVGPATPPLTHTNGSENNGGDPHGLDHVAAAHDGRSFCDDDHVQNVHRPAKRARTSVTQEDGAHGGIDVDMAEAHQQGASNDVSTYYALVRERTELKDRKIKSRRHPDTFQFTKHDRAKLATVQAKILAIELAHDNEMAADESESDSDSSSGEDVAGQQTMTRHRLAARKKSKKHERARRAAVRKEVRAAGLLHDNGSDARVSSGEPDDVQDADYVEAGPTTGRRGRASRAGPDTGGGAKVSMRDLKTARQYWAQRWADVMEDPDEMEFELDDRTVNVPHPPELTPGGGGSRRKKTKRSWWNRAENGGLGKMLGEENPVAARAAAGPAQMPAAIKASNRRNQLNEMMFKIRASRGSGNAYAEDDAEQVRMDRVMLEEAIRSFGYRKCSAKDGFWTLRKYDYKPLLYNLQIVGISWMLRQEFSPSGPWGGILADEMGLGKTIQLLGVMAVNQPSPGEPRPTLIVVPAAALLQWKSEIGNFTNFDKVIVFRSRDHLGIPVLRDMDIM